MTTPARSSPCRRPRRRPSRRPPARRGPSPRRAIPRAAACAIPRLGSSTRGAALLASEDLPRERLDFAADPGRPPGQLGDEPVGDKVDNRDGRGDEGRGELRTGTTALDGLEEGEEGLEGGDDAADRAPGSLQAFDDDHDSTGSGDDHRHQLFDQDADQGGWNQGLDAFPGHRSDDGEGETAAGDQAQDHPVEAEDLPELGVEPFLDRRLESTPQVVADAVDHCGAELAYPADRVARDILHQGGEVGEGLQRGLYPIHRRLHGVLHRVDDRIPGPLQGVPGSGQGLLQGVQRVLDPVLELVGELGQEGPSTLKKTDPFILRELDPLNAQKKLGRWRASIYRNIHVAVDSVYGKSGSRSYQVLSVGTSFLVVFFRFRGEEGVGSGVRKEGPSIWIVMQ